MYQFHVDRFSEAITTGRRKGFGVQLTALAQQAFDYSFGLIIQQRVGHATNAGRSMLVTAPEGRMALDHCPVLP